MICPHCEYVTGMNWEEDELIQAEEKYGEFYVLPVELRRNSFATRKVKQLYGCPKCSKTFID